MQYGFRNKAVQESTRIDLLGNKLVLIAAADAAMGDVAIGPGLDLAALAGKGRIVTGDVRAVPVGRYAQAALEKLGLWPSVQSKLAMVENVRVALSLVARGEAPLGIVYETDARAEPKVKVIGVFPSDSHPPIVYPAALTAGAKSGGAAYLEFLQSSLARGIFEKRGFIFLARSSSRMIRLARPAHCYSPRSFPRKREPRGVTRQWLWPWIPAFAGMSGGR